LQSVEEFFSCEVTTLVTDAPESRLERSNRAASSTTALLPQPNITGQAGTTQINLAPLLSPSPITPVSNTTWSPISVEDSSVATKKSGAVAVSKIYYKTQNYDKVSGILIPCGMPLIRGCLIKCVYIFRNHGQKLSWKSRGKTKQMLAHLK
jgi:hypothetical protein